MKQIKFIMLGLAGLLFGCQQAELDTPEEKGAVEMQTVTISAGIGGTDTKASLDSQTGAFTWQSGDVISVLATDGKFYDFTLDGEAGGKEAEFKGNIPQDAEITTVATYPAIVANGTENTFFSESTLNYVLPAAWDYTKDVSNVPMVATFGEGEPDHMSFKQIGGVMRFPVKNLPKEAKFVVTMNDKTITGQFPIDVKSLGEAAMTAGAAASSEVVINYSSDVDGADAVFNVPVPTGTYNNFTVTVKDASDKVLFTKNYSKDNKVSRATLLNMKELVLNERASLAKVYITTPGGASITSKTVWIDATIRIIDESGNEDLNMRTEIRGRGNTTWTYPKKPYALKLDSKAKVLGMPKHKRWVLLANWMDRTLMRNDVAFEIARRVMEWAPRGKFVEVYLNDVHQGNYYLCEQIKIDENRVNVDKLDEDTDFSNTETITGGYLLEFDEYAQNDEPNFFWSKVIDTDDGTPIAIKEPDEDVITSSTHPAFQYIQNYIHNLEDLFEADKESLARWNEIENLIDVTSYIDYWFIHELTSNLEPNQPRSCYMYKKRGGKLYAGPVWDFDYRTFNPDYDYYNIKATLWYPYLFKYSQFKSAVKLRWAELEQTFRGIDKYIETTAEVIRESNAENIKMWPISSTVNGDESMTYDDAIQRMRAAYSYRIELVKTNVSAL